VLQTLGLSLSSFAIDVLGAAVLLIWLCLVFARGRFWWLRDFDDDIAPHDELRAWPRVVAIVPARNEAETIARAVESLAAQNYGG
jgi:cellulose synthase/poly-beta-1,6-N-acetylglucosamine synthase-like glycosyltransferase